MPARKETKPGGYICDMGFKKNLRQTGKKMRLIVEFRGENDIIFLMKRRLEEALIGID